MYFLNICYSMSWRHVYLLLLYSTSCVFMPVCIVMSVFSKHFVFKVLYKTDKLCEKIDLLWLQYIWSI